MSTFNDDFDITLPVGSSFARNGQVELRKTRRSMQERLDLEHYGPGLGNQDNAHPGADGRHRPGKVSVVLLDTESNILATTPGASGALAFSTDTKKLFIWDGSDWDTHFIGGGVMKQIIRGITSVPFNSPQNVTIATVDPLKCVVLMTGIHRDYTQFSFPDATTLRLTNTNTSGTAIIQWQVIEYT
jgi:hypothetical protein